jgi:hypothetical protein
MNIIGKDVFKALFRENRGAEVVTITAVTKVELAADGRAALGTVYKRSIVNGMVNWKYESSVNKQREREGLATDFEAMPRKWGVRVDGTPFVEHKGKDYLELKVQNPLGHEYVDAQGNALARELVEQYLPAKGASRQGVRREVMLRDYSFESLRAVAMRGETYVLA